jgi:glycogen debranching enzyme
MPSASDFDLPESMHNLVATVAAPGCVLGDRDGQVRPDGVQGLYVSDVRVLHGARITLDDRTPVGLGWASAGPAATVFHGIVPGLGDPSPDPTVRIERTRTARPDGLDETIRVRTTAVAPIHASLTLSLTPDMTPLTIARSGRAGPSPVARADGDDLVWSHDGVTVTAAADAAAIDVAAATVRWAIDLRCGDEIALRWSVRVRDLTSLTVVARSPIEWTIPVVVAPDPRLGRLVEQALDDLASLRLADAATPEDTFIAAGAPWFLTLFGRDSIWAARMMLPLGTGLAESTLRTLANHQGTHVDPASGEEPGKIMHEWRSDDIRIRPASPRAAGSEVYYGTIDATPLWISLLADAWRWGMAEDVVLGFLPYLRNALTWLSDYGDAAGDGFISYVDRTGRGLANQGWKDSGNAVRFRDGTIAAPPIALCEVQGYAHRAALDAAVLLDAFGDVLVADRWRDYATRLADRFRARFWVDGPLGPHPALALDRDGRAVDALTSNIGHLLGTGLLSGDEESTVARMLGLPTLAGGYGLRTMSDLDAAYDPLSYHCGSIWPHDTAITLLGLATMPDDPDAQATAATLAEGLLTAAEAFDYRLPELFSGDARTDTGRPLPHPAACRPQAWAAAAAIVVLQARLASADARSTLATSGVSAMPGTSAFVGSDRASGAMALQVDGQF